MTMAHSGTRRSKRRGSWKGFSSGMQIKIARCGLPSAATVRCGALKPTVPGWTRSFHRPMTGSSRHFRETGRWREPRCYLMATESTGRLLAQLGVPSIARGTVRDIGPGQTPEACGRGQAYEVAIRKSLPPAFPSAVAGNLETGRDGDQVHIHIGIKRPHGRSQ